MVVADTREEEDLDSCIDPEDSCFEGRSTCWLGAGSAT